MPNEFIPLSHEDGLRIANALESLPGVIGATPISNGGTGATTLEGAQENLGIAELKEEVDGSVKSVNSVTPDANGNVDITHVLTADNLTADDAQDVYGQFDIRATGGGASISDGDSWLNIVQGNSIRTGYSSESKDMTVTNAVRPTPEEDEEEIEEISATIDWDVFKSAVGGASTVIDLNFTSVWSASPATYGVTVTGTPYNGDNIHIAFVAENRGTITNGTPVSFVSTGWNLYNHDTGYARVIKYSPTQGFRIDGAYSALRFSTTISGEKSTLSPSAGLFAIPSDGYVWVTGGNDTTTAIYMTWSDWTGGYPGSFEPYDETTVDVSSVMTAHFPYGLCSVGAVMDEINIQLNTATRRIDRVAYNSANLATIQASGVAYWYDTDYIYSVLQTPVVESISVDGQVEASDHGIELFSGTAIPVWAHILYGQNLKDKLRTDVLTISPQVLTPTQKAQARTNIGAADDANVVKLTSQSITSEQAAQVQSNLGMVMVNNLERTTSGGVLDARQGKALDDKITSLTDSKWLYSSWTTAGSYTFDIVQPSCTYLVILTPINPGTTGYASLYILRTYNRSNDSSKAYLTKVSDAEPYGVSSFTVTPSTTAEKVTLNITTSKSNQSMCIISVRK